MILKIYGITYIIDLTAMCFIKTLQTLIFDKW